MAPLKLLDQVREAIRLKHFSYRTEEAYVGWIRRFVLFHGKRHPREMGTLEIRTFLSDLATNGKVAASTQKQALAALLFLYRVVLGLDLPSVDGVMRAKGPVRLPVVLTREEVRALLAHCGLPFEDGCLRFYENDRAVRTASSEQVRQPIFTDATEHWRNYDAWLEPLKTALGPVLHSYPEPPRY